VFRIKICGVTTPADALYAVECGADAVGLNFYPRSPRFLTSEQAAAIVRELPPGVVTVGLFVGESVESIRAVVRQLGLRAVQTYPDTEQPEDADWPVPHIPAFRVKDAASLERVRDHVRAKPAAVLLDAYVEGQLGGTGHRAPWELLAGFDPGVPVILAGGLTPENVAEAIRLVRPWGVDVASGVESAPGTKDRGKVRAFVQAARAAASVGQ
jgi:phosphoribosylanthranilate isomerase